MAFYTSTHRSISRAHFEAKNQAAEFVASGHLAERVGRVSIHFIVHGAEGIRQSRQFFVAFQHSFPKVHPQSVALAEKAQE